jgi:hypothetical protein
MEINLPVDYERLPEFRMLCAELQGPCRTGQPSQTGPKAIEASATFVWMRLWVELAYLAQTTNRPGFMTAQGMGLFERSLDPMFGDDCSPATVLEKCGALKRDKEEWYCDRFAKMNAHLAGNYQSKERRGAAASAVERNRQRIAAEAGHQAMLIGPENFRRRDGTPMESGEVQRAMVLIATVDRCLGLPGRTKGKFNETLITDAGEVVREFGAASLNKFYVWLQMHRGHPRLPTTTEQILGEFKTYAGMASE